MFLPPFYDDHGKPPLPLYLPLHHSALCLWAHVLCSNAVLPSSSSFASFCVHDMTILTAAPGSSVALEWTC